jgi:putative FmdB family regulatory protein
MPIYEYQCKKCGQFEVMQKITQRSLTRCPTCQSKVTKLMSNTSFQLKGSGWYVTDYARKGGTSSETSSSETGKESKSETKSESKTESKPEAGTGSSDTKTKSDGKTSKSKEAAAA